MSGPPAARRQAVHAASGHRLGAADPRQEGPADLRLVVPAAAAWAAAALAVGAPPRWTAAAVAVCVVCAALLLAPVVVPPLRNRGGCARAVPAGRSAHRVRPRREPGRPAGRAAVTGRGAPTLWRRARSGFRRAAPDGDPARSGHRAGGGPDGAGPGGNPGGGHGGRRGLNAVACAAVLLCAAAGASAAGLHTAELRRGPVPGLAERYATVTAEATVVSDPRVTVSRGRSGGWGSTVVVIGVDITRVAGAGGRATATRTPVLLIVRPAAGPRHLARWQGLLPSTRLALTGRLSPAVSRGDTFAAVLRVTGRPPQVTGPPTAVQRTAGRLRAGLREATDGLPPDARALVPGITVGDTSRLTPELRKAFEVTDLTHVLAVSGSNLTIVLVLLIGPPGRAGRVERGGLAPRLGITLRGTALAGGGLTLAFVVVCRPEPSVLRAAACGALTLLAIGTGRRRSLVPALAAAVLLLVLYDPLLARNYGFVLSVLATGALLLIAPGWSAALRRRGVPPRLAEVLAVSAAAQAVSAPVVAIFTAKVSLVSVPCNLAVELATAPATVLGFAALATATVSIPAAVAPATAAGWFARWIAAVARGGAALPGAQTDWPGGWQGGLLLAAAGALAVLLIRGLSHRPWAAAAVAVVLLCAVVRPAPLARVLSGWPPPGWDLVICDVGQGDAMVLAAGPGAAVVVDTGPDPEAVDRCLRELGINRVPLVVLTHFHADHVRGLPGVLRGRAVGAVQTTVLDRPPTQAAFVRRAAAAAGIPLDRARLGERRRAGPLEWRVLWPDPGPGPWPAPAEANDASVTLLVRIAGGPVLLLLGDLEPPAQRALLRSRPVLGEVDVVKVAHHGSAHQDPGLLRSVRPAFALISAGRDNGYGHPAPRTVAAYRELGAVVLRTDEDGDVAVSGTGRGLRAAIRGGRRRAGPRRPGTGRWSPAPGRGRTPPPGAVAGPLPSSSRAGIPAGARVLPGGLPRVPGGILPLLTGRAPDAARGPSGDERTRRAPFARAPPARPRARARTRFCSRPRSRRRRSTRHSARPPGTPPRGGGPGPRAVGFRRWAPGGGRGDSARACPGRWAENGPGRRAHVVRPAGLGLWNQAGAGTVLRSGGAGHTGRMDAYLRRIGAAVPDRADAAALRELQVRHLRSVPFENLAVHLGEGIVLDEKRLVDKVVSAGRGGICYELNGAFAALLRRLGFRVQLLQARVFGEDGTLGIPYDHLALLVETDHGAGRWLADVGFGEHARHPLAFDLREEQRDPAGTFRIVPAGRDAHGDLDLLRDGKPQYRLETRPRVLADFRAGAWWHSTSPESHFTRSLVCSRLTDDGRTTLSGRKLVTTRGGERHEELLPDDAAVLAAYRDHFGITLDRLPADPRGGADDTGAAGGPGGA